ncbi:MAG: right-handed parallel beta-helix repeat-containing protein [Pyrinomonadaceae bacterium]
MYMIRVTFRLFTLAMFVAAFGVMAQAQATRTWVSGVGDDLNPCSRTAPCKTFAGAISRTFINGEIDALDPGGFGTITITKSITLDGGTGSGWASILASGTNGVNINLTNVSGNDPQKTVRLRNLSINGTGSSGAVGTRTGINGVRIILATGSVFVENCLITDFSNRGITDERTTGGKLFVSDTTVRNTTATGIAIAPASGATAISATLDNVRVENCLFGVAVGNGGKAMISNSVFSGNGTGVESEGPFGASQLTVNACSINNNTTGILNGGSTTIRLSNNDIALNGTAITGATNSFGNNRISGNTAVGTAPTLIPGGQQ